MIYNKIRDICKEKGMSVAAVEKKAGLSHGAISKWNNSTPSAENLNSVAKIPQHQSNKQDRKIAPSKITQDYL